MDSLVSLIKTQWGKLPACSACNLPVHSKMLYCSGEHCEFTLYCNEQCQQADWVSHKQTCQLVGLNGKRKRTPEDEDEEEDDEEEDVGRPRKLITLQKGYDKTAWNLILQFLNLEDLKNVRLAGRQLVIEARRRMFNDYWVRLPNTVDEMEQNITPEIAPLLRNLHIVTARQFYWLREHRPVIYNNIRRLKFSWDFDRPVNHLPPNLTHLEFGWEFDQPVDHLPQSLTHLTFGGMFDQPVDHLPQGLTHLTFGSWFRHRVDQLPPGITHLTFGNHFDQPVDRLPPGITHLTFGNHFDQPVDQLPQSLTHLVFSPHSDFNQPVDHLPPTLVYLQFRGEFNQPVNQLPRGIEYFSFGWGFNQPVEDFPPGLVQKDRYTWVRAE